MELAGTFSVKPRSTVVSGRVGYEKSTDSNSTVPTSGFAGTAPPRRSNSGFRSMTSNTRPPAPLASKNADTCRATPPTPNPIWKM